MGATACPSEPDWGAPGSCGSSLPFHRSFLKSARNTQGHFSRPRVFTVNPASVRAAAKTLPCPFSRWNVSPGRAAPPFTGLMCFPGCVFPSVLSLPPLFSQSHASGWTGLLLTGVWFSGWSGRFLLPRRWDVPAGVGQEQVHVHVILLGFIPPVKAFILKTQQIRVFMTVL